MPETVVTSILRFTKTTPNTVRYDEAEAGSQPIRTLYILKTGLPSDPPPWIQVTVELYIPGSEV